MLSSSVLKIVEPNFTVLEKRDVMFGYVSFLVIGLTWFLFAFKLNIIKVKNNF